MGGVGQDTRGALRIDGDVESGMLRVERGRENAVVGCDADDRDVVDVAVAEVLLERPASHLFWIGAAFEAGVGRCVSTLVEDLVEGVVECGMELRATRVRDAMGRPRIDEVGLVVEVPLGSDVKVLGRDDDIEVVPMGT